MSPNSVISGSLLDFALGCGQGITVFSTGTATTDVPFTYCVGTVFVRINDYKIVAYDLQSGKVSTNRKTGNMANWDGWIPLITNTDLGGAVFKTASGNIQYGMNGIYLGRFANGPLQSDGVPFSSCIYLIGTGTNQTAVYAFAITQYGYGHLFFNRLNTASVMEFESWKKLLA